MKSNIDLSVVIVSYNVWHFLDQTIKSVYRAAEGLQVEIIVIDNASSDHTAEQMNSHHPDVHFVANTQNMGFSKANNQGIGIAQGEYILLLNPDTIVAEDTFTKCIDFARKNPKLGGLGVKMIDGQGYYLSESKRGLPGPWVSFCKITGLTRLFPRSKTFAHYYLGHLPNDQINKIEVLSGAFMWMPATLVKQLGGLDETFFMYGEDIDLSYRLLQSGHENVYFPDTTIIHFKGESTKRGSLNYVRTFYQAMDIFVRKHYKKQQLYRLTIRLAIWARAILAIVSRFVKKISLPAADALVIFLGLILIKNRWAAEIKGREDFYPDTFNFVLLAYTALWLLGLALLSNYSSARSKNIVKGILVGTLAISAFSNFIDPLRFSKAIILFGSIWAFVAALINRNLYYFATRKTDKEAIRRKISLLISSNISHSLKTLVYQPAFPLQIQHFIGSADTLPLDTHTAYALNIESFVWDTASLSYKMIIKEISRFKGISHTIVDTCGEYAIITGSKTSQGSVFVSGQTAQNQIDSSKKRQANFIICVMMLPAWLAGKNKHWWKVVSGKANWVGLSTDSKPAYLLIDKSKGSFQEGFSQTYRANYSLMTDVKLFWKNRKRQEKGLKRH